jgi:hypothetical protein
LNYNDITTLGTVEASKTVTADASGDVLFPDSDKAIFGADSDLQIYHDGSHSFISDQGTGNLKILASTIDLNNAANTENMITAVEDGAVTLYHDNAAKIATTATGIDVTGTVTVSNISVNTITDASGGSTASINGLTPQASNMQPFNRIINGAMTIDQRNAGASVTLPSTGSQYTLDRWTAASSSASKYSVQQNAGSVTPPAGFTNYLGVTSLRHKLLVIIKLMACYG